MALNNQLDGYSHPTYTALHESRMSNVQGPVSTTDFAHFRSRNTVIVRAVHVYMRSAASTTLSLGSLHVTRNGTTIKGATWAASAAGASILMTLASSNTLVTITDYAAIRLVGFDVGQYDVLWEYDVVYPATKIGS